MIAFSPSFGPESSVSVSTRSTSSRSESNSRCNSAVTFSPSLRQIKIGGDVAGAARQIALQRQQALQALALAHHLLRFFRIRPQTGIRRLLLYFGELLAQFVAVKDTPGDRAP